MPLIAPSTYRPPPLISNGHLQTILPSLMRRVNGVTYRRERIATPDDDFLDLDWSSRSQHSGLVVLCHGLEGSTATAYMKGMVRVFNRAGWSALGINFRGCSGVLNRRLRSYHSGATDDLVVSSNVVGGFGISKSGPGVMVLTAGNGYSGDTTVSGGTLLANGLVEVLCLMKSEAWLVRSPL